MGKYGKMDESLTSPPGLPPHSPRRTLSNYNIWIGLLSPIVTKILKGDKSRLQFSLDQNVLGTIFTSWSCRQILPRKLVVTYAKQILQETCPYFLPMIIRTASRINVRARSSTVSGNVALNNDRIIDGFEHALTIKSICFTKPSSKSMSDSSRTRNSTL